MKKDIQLYMMHVRPRSKNNDFKVTVSFDKKEKRWFSDRKSCYISPVKDDGTISAHITTSGKYCKNNTEYVFYVANLYPPEFIPLYCIRDRVRSKNGNITKTKRFDKFESKLVALYTDYKEKQKNNELQDDNEEEF